MRVCLHQCSKLFLRKLRKYIIVTIFISFVMFNIIVTRYLQPQHHDLQTREEPLQQKDAHIGILNARPEEMALALFPEDSIATDRILEQLRYSPKPLDRLVYIYFNFNGPAIGKKEFIDARCSILNCVLTNTTGRILTADAVIFKNSLKRRLETVHQDQIWIYYSLESPQHVRSTTETNDFNWTATYRWDSDLVAPYERFTPWKDVPQDQKHQHPLDGSNYTTVDNYAKRKTKQAVWFASNCGNMGNNREKYVEQLAQHMSVDSFGKCGKSKSGCMRGDQKCWNRLNTEYKFYLAFENSNCRDYVTEKLFWNGLGYNVLPVVMGAPYAYYKKIAPPHSFIHVDQFNSTRKLAEYLLYLDKNDTAYKEYFKWKGTGKFIHTKFWCRLCNLLNGPKPRKHYANLDEWWRGKNGSYCHNPGPWGNVGKYW